MAMMKTTMTADGDNDDDKDDEEKDESLEPVADAQAEVSVEGKQTEAMHKDKKDMKKEAMHGMKKKPMKEYKISKSADTADHSDTKDSPVAKKGGADMGANGKNIAQGGEEQGRAAPTAEKMGSFENSPGKDKGTSFKKQMKANTADGSDKSGKSAIAGK